MDIFVNSKVFNPNLFGKAVRVKGFDIDGEHYNRLFLVRDVNGEHISLINCQGGLIKDLHIENFEHSDEALKITILEEEE